MMGMLEGTHYLLTPFGIQTGDETLPHPVAPLLHPSAHPLSGWMEVVHLLDVDSKWCFDVASPQCVDAFRNSRPLSLLGVPGGAVFFCCHS